MIIFVPDYVCVLDLGMFELSLFTSDGSEQVRTFCVFYLAEQFSFKCRNNVGFNRFCFLRAEVCLEQPPCTLNQSDAC